MSLVALLGLAPVSAHASSSVTLSNGLVTRQWSVGGELVTTALIADVTGRNWVTHPAPDFSLTIDGVPWPYRVLTTTTGPSSVSFRLVGLGLEIDRTYTLAAGSPVIDVSMTLVNHLPVPVRVGDWTIDQIGAGPTSGSLAPRQPPVEVDALHGGSD